MCETVIVRPWSRGVSKRRIAFHRVVFVSGNRDNFTDKELQCCRRRRLFHIGFTITTHKSQGETYDEDYAIWEWEQMSYPLKYVSLSRGTNKNIICIN